MLTRAIDLRPRIPDRFVRPLRLCLLLLFSAGMFTGCSRDPNVRKQMYFESGQRYFQRQKYQEAAIQFSNAIQVDSGFVDAHYRLAQSYMKQEDWNDAYNELTETVDLQPGNYPARIDLGNLLLAAHSFKQAQQQADLLLKQDANDPLVHVLQANIYGTQNNPSAALPEMQQAVQLSPGRSEFYLNYAILQFKAGQLNASETSFKRALALSPTSVATLLGLANLYEQQAHWSDAERQLRRAITLDPKDPQVVAALARLYLVQGKKTESEQLLMDAKQRWADNPDAYRMLGDYYFAIGDLDKAVAEYSSLFREHRKDVQIKRNYIQLLILKNQLGEAEKLTDELLQANGKDIDALVYRGQIQIRHSRLRDAVGTLLTAVNYDPDSVLGHYHLGVAFDRLGEVSQATAEWERAAQLQPDFVDVESALASVAMRTNDMPSLQQRAQKIIDAQPYMPEGYVFRAIAELNQNQSSTGENDLRKAMEVAPQNPIGYVQMGNLRLAQKRFAESEKLYGQALAMDANAADALAGLASLYLQQKQSEKALARIQAQINKVPRNSTYHYLLGTVFAEQKQWDDAEKELNTAVDLDNGNSYAVLELGQIQVARGFTDQAIATYQASIRHNPADVHLYILVGQLQESKGNWQQAQEMYEKALQEQPDNALAANNLAYLLLERDGDLDTALSLAQVARRGMSNSPNTADTLGWAYYQKGIYGSAIDLLREAVKSSPTDSLYHYHLGLAYQKTKEVNQAKLQLELALKTDAKEESAERVRRALAELRGNY